LKQVANPLRSRTGQLSLHALSGIENK